MGMKRDDGNASEMLSISKVAARAGVHIQTLRYYERRGLIPAPKRAASGYRQYSAESVRIVIFIKRAQELGFTLREVQALLELRKPRPGRRVLRRERDELPDLGGARNRAAPP
jgi:DNA-binding transcriptional MerR regulator